MTNCDMTGRSWLISSQKNEVYVTIKPKAMTYIALPHNQYYVI